MRTLTVKSFLSILFFFLSSLSGNAQCAPEIPGYSNIGMLNGHSYYLSTSNARPTDAQAAAEALGGYLAVINDADENQFIELYIDELTYIGFNDANTEGTIETVNGEPVTYTNVDPCNFCQSNDDNNDFVVMEPWGNQGNWSFSNFWNQRKYIIEIPCSTSNNSSECSFITEWSNQNNLGSYQTRVTEDTDSYEVRFEAFSGGLQRRLVKWTLDKLGNETSTTDVTFPYPTGMDFGRISFLGDHFFMHEIVGINPQLNKYDFSGNTIFSKTYTVNTTISNINYTASRDAWEDEDGILVTGHSGDGPTGLRQPFLIKTDLDGNEQWQILLTTENAFVSLNVQGRSNDGGYYLLLRTNASLPTKIIKIDESGNILWTHTTTKNSSFVDREFLGESADGSGFFFVQNDVSATPSFGYLGFKLNPTTGEVVWEKEIGELFSLPVADHDFISRPSVTSNDGGILVDFTYLEDDPNSNQPLFEGEKYGKIDANGNLEWGYEKPVRFAKYILPRLGTSDGGFLLIGNLIFADKNSATKITSEGWYSPICESNVMTGLQVDCDLNIDPAQLTVVGTNDITGRIVDWTLPTATTDCPGGIVTIEQIDGPPSGSFLEAWVTNDHTVRYKITDACGNEEICTTLINVEGILGEFNCLNDITVNATSPTGAIVNYDMPTITPSTCPPFGPQLVQGLPSGSEFPVGTTQVTIISLLGGSLAYCQQTIECSFNVTVVDGNTGGCPGDITGFTTIGEFGNSKYYISNDLSRPVDAQAIAESHGGYLVTINSQAENDFVQQGTDGLTYIGLNDENTEGTLAWFNGEPVSYNNVNPCGFCNENSADQDYAVIQPWDGGWSFSNFWNQRKYIMEIPCGNTPSVECGFITSYDVPNVYTFGGIEFEEVNDKYEFEIKYNGISGLNEAYETNVLSQEGIIENTTGSPYPTGIVYEASVNGLTIDLTASIDGNQQWSKNFSIQTNDPDLDQINGLIVVEDASGIWILGGYHYGMAATWRTFTIRTDLDGNFLFQNIHDTISDFPVFLTQQSNQDGGIYFLLRNSAATGILYRTGADGNVEWTKNIIGDLVSNRIQIIGDASDNSGLYIGIQDQFISVRIRKYSISNGDIIWENTITNTFNNIFGTGTINTGGIPTLDGGVVASFTYNEPSGAGKTYAEYGRLDGDGNVVWWHNLPLGLRFAGPIGATSDGGFIFHTSIGGKGRIIKMNADGLFDPACTSNEKPDLQPANLQTNSFNYQVGETATINFDIHNNSLTSATSNYTVEAYIRSNVFGAPNDMLVGSFVYSNTLFGINNFSENVTIPNVQEGTYKIVLNVDTGNEIDELFETNNEDISFNFQVEAASNNLPDLTVSNITNLPSSGENGEVVFFNFDLNNIGTITASGNYLINIYISEDDVYSPNDFFAGEIPTGDTPVGTITNVPAAITVPSANNGDYYLIIVADEFDDIAELNENNNTISTPFAIGSGGGGCPTSFSGFTSLGEFNGSAYFISDDVARPTDAQIAASNIGGNLAVINSQAENDFLYPLINELVYIGMNDATTEGTLEWVNGDAVNYTNFDICSFCNENTSDFDYVVMHSWNGGWSWSNIWNQRKYIVEVPCTVPLTNSNIGNTLVALPSQVNVNVLLGKVFPNPANDLLNISLQSPTDQEVQIQIMDARGVLVKSEKIDVHNGSNTIELNINELPSGFYMIHVPDAQSNNRTKRFMKLRD